MKSAGTLLEYKSYAHYPDFYPDFEFFFVHTDFNFIEH